MEPLGAVAATLNLVEAASGAAKTARNTIQRYRHAERDVLEPLNRVRSLRHDLEQIVALCSSGPRHLFAKATNNEFGVTLAEIGALVQELEAALCSLSSFNRTRTRVWWAVYEYKVIERLLSRLKKTEERLRALMVTAILQGTSLIVASTSQQEECLGDLVGALSSLTTKAYPAKIEAISSDSSCSELSPTSASRKPRSYRRLRSRPRSLKQLYGLFGIILDYTPTFCERGRLVEHTFAVSMHGITLSGPWRLSLALVLSTTSSSPGGFTLGGHGCTSVRVRDQEDEFFTACRVNDVEQVRNLIESGLRRVDDVDDQGRTPLAIAIIAGAKEVVRNLIDRKADMNSQVGLRPTTPVQLAVWTGQVDILRLLLESGASHDEINSIGWNSVFYCWPVPERRSERALESFRILANHAYLDLDTCDRQGWTALHRASAFHSAEEVRALIREGADPRQAAKPLQWNAIYHSVFYRNQETFEELIPEYPTQIHVMRDTRHWTLLHLAAERVTVGQGPDIIRELIKRGCDPYALSEPCWEKVPDVLRGRSCTPADVVIETHSPAEARVILEQIPEWEHALQELDARETSTTYKISLCNFKEPQICLIWLFCCIIVGYLACPHAWPAYCVLQG